MNFTLETREGLLQAISYLEEDRESTNALEKLAFKCLQKAQELNEQDLEYRVRIALIVIHNDLHKTDLVVSMFPWLLNTCDNNEGRYDYKQILWYYRWIITAAKHYSSIPKSKLFELMEDFERRFREAGIGEKIIHDCKFYFYAEMGELELAEKEYVLWQSASYNILYECRKCERDFLNSYLRKVRRATGNDSTCTQRRTDMPFERAIQFAFGYVGIHDGGKMGRSCIFCCEKYEIPES